MGSAGWSFQVVWPSGFFWPDSIHLCHIRHIIKHSQILLATKVQRPSCRSFSVFAHRELENKQDQDHDRINGRILYFFTRTCETDLLRSCRQLISPWSPTWETRPPQTRHTLLYLKVHAGQGTLVLNSVMIPSWRCQEENEAEEMSKEKEPNEEHFGENAFENTKKKCQPIELEPQNLRTLHISGTLRHG